MTEILELIDLGELRHQVQEKYGEVASDQTGALHPHHFHTGRAHAIRLGYATSHLNDLPEEACEAFASVGNPFYWGVPTRVSVHSPPDGLPHEMPESPEKNWRCGRALSMVAGASVMVLGATVIVHPAWLMKVASG